jgi:hypothetical protein
VILLLATPAEAHCYRIWHYPKPQRCFTTLAPAKPASRIPETFRERITLPALDWVECPPANERLRGIAFLRALRDVPASR